MFNYATTSPCIFPTTSNDCICITCTAFKSPLLILIIDRRETSLFAIESALEAANRHLQCIRIQRGNSLNEDRI
jgi:hypothetical protein